MNALQDKVAVITGGSRGLGLAIAKAYTQEGARVVIGSRSSTSIEQAITAIRSQGGQATGQPCDVMDLEQVQSLAQHALREFGRLDIWVNNAGIGAPIGPTIHIPPKYMNEVINTNINGVYNGSWTAMQHFLQQGAGKLINISGRGEKTPTPNFNPYGASKSWIYSFTMALAKEYRHSGVGVFLFQPGLVRSDMMGHLYFIEGYEEELLRIFRVVARLFSLPPHLPSQKAVWLASEATDGQTGLHVNLLRPGTMLKGIGKEMLRIVTRKPVPPLNSKISLVPPAIGIPDTRLVSGTQARSPAEAKEKAATQTPLQKAPGKPLNLKYITTVHQKQPPISIGNKAASLHFLWNNGYPIPVTYVCTWDAYLANMSYDERLLLDLRQELSLILDPNKSYAIRSSANIEDTLERSFAGQFSTFLDVRGTEHVLEAIQQIWRDTQSQAVASYLNRMDSNDLELKMAVIIQEMVLPSLSGVSFSKNPITTLDEVIVEAVEGRGIALVQEGKTPLRWVNKWGGWISAPEVSPVSTQVIEQIVQQTKTIARNCQKEVDLEWVYDGTQVYWLQLRDITSIDTTVYSNRMAKEMTPGMVQPLVWSVVIPLAAKAVISLFTEVIGKNNLDHTRLVRSFHHRAYHNMTEFGLIFEGLGLPRESLEMMLGITPDGAGKPPMKPSLRTIGRIPGLLRFGYDKWTLGKRLANNYPRLYQQAHSIPLPVTPGQSEAQLLEQIDRNRPLNLELTSLTVVTIILMQLYNRLLYRQLKSMGIDFQNFNLTSGMNELEEIDPVQKIRSLHQEYLDLPQPVRCAIESGDLAALQALPSAGLFCQHFDAFLSQFGHLSDATGHFGSPPWRETPGFILQMIAKYQAPEPALQQKLLFDDLEKPSPMLRFFYQRARQFRLFREKYSLLYSYSLMVFRAYYLAIGERFKQRGILDRAEDVLFLYDEEVRAVIAGQSNGDDFPHLVAARQQEFEQDRTAILPEIIFGEVAPLVVRDYSEKLNGVPTSKGYYTGKACIIQSLNDFDKLERGDILVIPYSDVSWTPLFANAGAVVAESGGILSHSSIIAREYNIPAVVSVSGAVGIPDGAQITVDGYRGEVLLHDNVQLAMHPLVEETLED
jgi:pyruvate,water dikinase